MHFFEIRRQLHGIVRNKPWGDAFARKYFNGGGHFNAAGGRNKEPLDVVVKKFMEAIKENKEQLNN